MKKIIVIAVVAMASPAFAKSTPHRAPDLPPAGYYQCYASNVSGTTWYYNHKKIAKAIDKAMHLCRKGSPRVIKKTCHTKPRACVGG